MNFINVLSDALRQALGPEAALFALVAIGLNMHFGYTGLLNFGQVGFMMLGAYGIAIMVTTVGQSLWLGLLLSLIAALVLAAILAVTTLRLRADYLAITTLATAEALRLVFNSASAQPVTGGVYGLTQFADGFYNLNPIPPGTYGVGPIAFSSPTLWVMIVAWALVLLAGGLVLLLTRSPWGRLISAIRDDEFAARSLGKNVLLLRTQSLIIGGLMGALGGILLALNQQSITPESFLPELTFFAFTIMLLGGAGRAFSPIVGSFIFWFVVAGTDSFLQNLVQSNLLPASVGPQTVGATRFVLVGVGLMLLVIFRPQGIFGDRRRMLLDEH